MNKRFGKILFIVEGTKVEPIILKNFKKFFALSDDKHEIDSLFLPSDGNVYSLWKMLDEDDDLDIVELCKEKISNSSYDVQKKVNTMNGGINISDLKRDDFSEVYLFF